MKSVPTQVMRRGQQRRNGGERRYAAHLPEEARRRTAPSPQRKWIQIAAFLAAIAMSLIPLIGSIGVLVFIACGGILAILNWRINLGVLAKFSWLLAFPFLAIISTIWSDAPQQTMRSGLQLLLTVIIAILVGRNLSPKALIAVLFLGAAALCASAIPNIPRALESGQPLTSSFLGSKNQIGFASFLMFAGAVAICSDRNQPRLFRLVALIALPTSLWIAYYSQSGGGTVSILLTAAFFPMFACLAFLKPRGRIVLITLGVVVFALAALLRTQIEQVIATFRADVLAKNETLTGRTYLWDVADNLWQTRPLLGHGYAAFWRHGNLEAEALWRWGGITTRSGFNFHNVLVETKVDLGLVGVAVLVATMAAVTLLSIWRQLRDPTIAGAFFTTALLVLFFRSTIEGGLMSQFNVMALIWGSGGVYAVTQGRERISPLSSAVRRRSHRS